MWQSCTSTGYENSVMAISRVICKMLDLLKNNSLECKVICHETFFVRENMKSEEVELHECISDIKGSQL